MYNPQNTNSHIFPPIGSMMIEPFSGTQVNNHTQGTTAFANSLGSINAKQNEIESAS